MNPISIRKTLIASCVALALGTPAAQAALVTNVLGANTWYTDSANFTMLAANGGVVGGPIGNTNDVKMAWDGNAYNTSSDYTGPGSAANVTMSSTAPFFGHAWTAHDIQMFTPGSYSFDVTLGGGVSESGTLNVTVPSGDLGIHLLWDWNGGANMDIFVVFGQNSIFGSGLLYSTQTSSKVEYTCEFSYTGTITKNCIYDNSLYQNPSYYGSAGAPTKNEVWMLASIDGNSDGVMGIPMASGGPLAGFNANFNANLAPTPKAVPVPAAVWLFGSGLTGLIGIAVRRKR